MVKAVNNAATGGLLPNLTLLLDMPPEKGLERKRAAEHDRFEKEDPAFHQKVRKGYLELATKEPERFLVIDASQSKEAIAEIIWQKVSPMLPRRA